jgi:electron transfer flavoprotein alpha subunit
MRILVVAEHDNKVLKQSTLNTLSAAKQLNAEIDVLVAGCHCANIVENLRQIPVVSQVFVADHVVYEHPLAETFAALIIEIIKKHNITHVFAPATTFGKNILPRVAALANVSQLSDIIEIVDQTTYRRPIYAGNAIETVKSNDALQIVTVRPSAFALSIPLQNGNAKVHTVDYVADNSFSAYIQSEVHVSDRPDLSSADIVISGGRGLASKENFERLTAIAGRMGAAVGASRAAVDAGFAPNDFQVGQTGKVVAPKLYIALGISGAIQHLAGMKESKVIIAVNKDADAPIFRVADYGLLADVQEVLAKWENWLSKKV